MGGFSAAAKEHLRAAFIGLGYRGNDHLRNFASLPGTTVVGLCDLYQDHVEEKLSTLQNLRPELNKEEVKTYWGDEDAWRSMLDEVQPDLVFISTNWANHAPMAIGCMEKGAHAFVEVPLATSIEDLWAIIDTRKNTTIV